MIGTVTDTQWLNDQYCYDDDEYQLKFICRKKLNAYRDRRNIQEKQKFFVYSVPGISTPPPVKEHGDLVHPLFTEQSYPMVDIGSTGGSYTNYYYEPKISQVQ